MSESTLRTTQIAAETSKWLLGKFKGGFVMSEKEFRADAALVDVKHLRVRWGKSDFERDIPKQTILALAKPGLLEGILRNIKDGIAFHKSKPVFMKFEPTGDCTVFTDSNSRLSIICRDYYDDDIGGDSYSIETCFAFREKELAK